MDSREGGEQEGANATKSGLSTKSAVSRRHSREGKNKKNNIKYCQTDTHGALLPLVGSAEAKK